MVGERRIDFAELEASTARVASALQAGNPQVKSEALDKARAMPLRAPLLERQRGDQTLNITTPLFEMPDKDGKHWTLRAETGWLSAKGDEMKLRGNVAGDSPAGPGVVPTTFRTDHLDVFPKDNRARTDALVTMTRPGMEQSGVGFEVDSKNNTYHFLSQSKGRYTPQR